MTDPTAKGDTPMTGTMPSWRNSPNIAIHPAAEMFPLLPEDELAALAADIKENRLREKAAVITKGGRQLVIDGRNRLDALELAGFTVVDEHGRLFKDVCIDLTKGDDLDLVDPAKVEAFIISKNIRRRHLTTEQRRELAAKLLRADPAKSNRAIADQIKLDKNTVQSVRADLEAGGEIHHVEERVGKDGKTQPAGKKSSRKKKQPMEAQPVASATDQPAEQAPVVEPTVVSIDAISEPQDQPVPATPRFSVRDLPFEEALAQFEAWLRTLGAAQWNEVEATMQRVDAELEPQAAA